MAKNKDKEEEKDSIQKFTEKIKEVNEAFGSFSRGLSEYDRVVRALGGGTNKAKDELLAGITKSGGGMTKMAGGIGAAVAVIDTGIKALKFLQDSTFAAAKAMAQMPLSTSQLANNLMKLQYDRDTFKQKWLNQFQNFDFNVKQADLSLEQQKMQYEKLFKTGAEKAQLTIEQAALGIKTSALGVKQAILGITQAQQAYQNALFSYEAAQIAAARANLDYQNKLMSIEGNLINARKAASEASKNYVKELQSLYEPWAKLDDAAATYTRTVGGSKESMKALKDQTLEFANSNNLQGKYNVSSEELIKFQTDYNKELGRSVRLTNSQTESLAAMMKVYDKDKSMEFLTKMTAFGYDFNKASGIAAKMFNDATKKGITVEKLSKNFLSNLKMAQTYSFSEGVKGLEKMAERATELHMNMEQTAKAADKLSTLEGAMEASANLSVLGGNFAQYSNPLSMLNEALNDVGSLQERIVQQFSDLAEWDSEKGEISMNGGDRLRMKAASSALGLDYGEMTDMVFEKARRDKLAPEINNLDVSDEIKHLLENTAQLNSEGKGYVNIDGKDVTLEEAAQMDPDKLAEALRVASSDDSDNIKTIAQSVVSIKDRFEGYQKAWDDSLSENIEKLGMGEEFDKMITSMTADKEEMGRSTKENALATKALAEFNKQKAAWQYTYAQGTAGFERRSADLQRRQTIFAEQTAKTGLLSALYGIESAKNSLTSAKLQARQAHLAQIEASYAPKEYDIQLRNNDLAIKRAEYQREFEMPLRRSELEYQYQVALNTMKMSYMQELMYKIDYAEKYAQIHTSDTLVKQLWGAIPVFGDWYKSIAGMSYKNEALDKMGTSYGDLLKPHEFENEQESEWLNNISKNKFSDIIVKNSNDLEFGDMKNKIFNTAPVSNRSVQEGLSMESLGFANGGTIRSTNEHYGGESAGYNRNRYGIVRGKQHSMGGVWTNLEGGEYIVRKASVAGNTNTLDAINHSNGALKLDNDANMQQRIASYNESNYSYTSVQAPYATSSDGNSYNPMSVAKDKPMTYEQYFNERENGISQSNSNTPKECNLNCDGKITIDILNGGAFTEVIAAELLKEPNLSKILGTLVNSNTFYGNAGTNAESIYFGNNTNHSA